MLKRPNKTDPYSINDKPTVNIVKGKGVQYAEIVWSTWASQVYRLWAGADYLEVEWSVGPIPIKESFDFFVEVSRSKFLVNLYIGSV